MYEDFVLKMNGARTARERSAVIEEMCRIFGFCKDSAYRALKESGWESNRKKRSDAGSSCVSDENLSTLAALLQNSLRKNGKKTMSIENARSIMIQNGFDIPIGNRQLAGLLKTRTLSTETTAKQSPFQRMRTEYPNQVHFADPSVALMYFAPNGGQKFLRDDEVYKNKPFLEGRESLKCWRYVLTDHFSGTICVKYYAAAGENSANMYDFLLYAWGKKKDPPLQLPRLARTSDLGLWLCQRLKASHQRAQGTPRGNKAAHAGKPPRKRTGGKVERHC